jgi:hypothetical protein
MGWTFPQSRIIVGYWVQGALQQDSDVAGGIRYAKSVASLIDLVGRKAHRNLAPWNQSRQLPTLDQSPLRQGAPKQVPARHPFAAFDGLNGVNVARAVAAKGTCPIGLR